MSLFLMEESSDAFTGSPFTLDQLSPQKTVLGLPSLANSVLCELCLRSLAADIFQHLPALGWNFAAFGSPSSTKVRFAFLFLLLIFVLEQIQKEVSRAILTTLS